MLSGDADANFKIIRTRFQLADDGTKFDGLRPGAEKNENALRPFDFVGHGR